MPLHMRTCLYAFIVLNLNFMAPPINKYHICANACLKSSKPLMSARQSGVPQGSVLGPLLFIIYVNDLASVSLSRTSKVILYADDLTLHRPITSANDYYVLQGDVTAIENWTTANNLQFNISKCKYRRSGNFCVFNFRHRWRRRKLNARKCTCRLCARNFSHVHEWQKFFYGKHFPIYGI